MYYSDRPIELEREDTLDRCKFSKNFAKTLNDFKNNETFTIGLFGEWGSGKTSIVNMALKELEELQKNEKNKTIVLKFEPWHFTSSTQLFNQFLIALANEFMNKKTKALNQVGQALSKYSSAFEYAELIPVPVLNKVIAKLGKWGAKKIGDSLQNNLEAKDILKQKEVVVKMLQNLNQKILIVIDDIDRLDNEQIRQVFQLVSAVAKFPNTIYLLVFDKNIVVKALEKVQEGNGEDYLKKVIQVPIQIPEIKTNKLFETLFNRLDKILNDHPQVRLYQDHWMFIFKYCIEPFIGNLRDISRLSNALEFKMTNIADEIDFADMVGISALEIREPKVYEWVKMHKNKLVGSFDGWSSYNKKEKEEYDIIYTEIKSLIDGKDLGIVSAERRIQETITALSCLFPAFGNSIGKNYISVNINDRRKYNLICHEDKFDRYFNMDIDDVVVKQSIVDKVIYDMNEKEIEETLRQMETKGKSYELLEEIEAVLVDIKEDRVYIILEGILNSAYYFEYKKAKSIMWISAQDKAEHLIYLLLKKFDISQRGEYLLDLIKKASAFNLETLAQIINMIELGFGRLAANGQERTEYGKMISIEELEKIEKEYATQCKIVFAKTSLFDLPSWRMTYHLWKNFDSGYVSSYLSEKFKGDNNVVIYLDELVGEWSGSGISYEVSKLEDEYITKDRILEAIKNLISNKKLFDLSERTQRKAAAYYLSDKQEVGYRGEVSQKVADDWLKEQKK